MVGMEAAEVIHEAAMGIRLGANSPGLRRHAAHLSDDVRSAENCGAVIHERRFEIELLRGMRNRIRCEYYARSAASRLNEDVP